MTSNKNERKLDAPAKMKEQGKLTDELVLNFINDNPDTTIREIAEHHKISNGKADHSVNRLKEKGLVEVQYFKRKRGLVKKIRAINSEITPFDEVSFPLTGLNSNKWKDEVFFCALSRSAIRVSPIMKDEWKNECILIQKTKLSKKENKIKFKIPEKFVEFYEIPNSGIDVSGIADEILLTINSTLIPVDIPNDTRTQGRTDPQPRESVKSSPPYQC